MSSDIANHTPQQLSVYPLLAPPEGVRPNFGTAENRNLSVFVVDAIFLVIMLVFFLNRIYTKHFIVVKYSWDDLTISFAVIGSITYYSACIWGAKRGRMGNHEWDISIAQSVSKDLLIPAYIISVLTPPTLLFLKVTFFIMYLNVFGPLRWLRICGYAGAIFTTLFYGTMTIVLCIFSTPGRGDTWFMHGSTRDAHDATALSVPQSSVGLAIDIVILILPIIAVMQLQLPTGRKIGAMLIFTTGILACLSSGLSIYYRNILSHSPDLMWNISPVNTVTVLEMYVGVICACTPSAAKSFKRHVQRFDSLRGYLSSYLPVSSLRRSKASSSSISNALSKYKSERFKQRQYSTIDEIYRSAQGKGRSISTFVQSGKQHNAENDGINLTFEMQNEVSSAEC